MRLPLRRSSLQLKITVLCIVIAVTAVLFVGISQYVFVPGILRNKTSEIRRGRLETAARGLEQRLDGVLAFADTFVSNAEINSALRRPDQTYTYGDATLISTVFRIAIVSQSDLIDSIVVATDRGKRFIGGNGGFLSHQIIGDRFAEMEKELRERSWAIQYETAPIRNFTQMVDVQRVVSLYYILRDTVSLDRIGVMYLSMNPSALLSVQEEEENSTVLLVDGDGKIIAGTDSGEMPEELSGQLILHSEETTGNFLFGKGEKSNFAVFTETTVPGWRLVEYIPYQSLIRESRQFFFLLLYVLAIAFAAIIFLTVYGTWKSLAPLRRLRDSMLAVQEGNYDVTVEVETNDEIGELAHTYNLMLGRIKQLIAEIYASEKQKREIELQVLQTQVNPHFLYNTLNSIHWMAVMHGLDSISNMVEALVAILRHSLQDFQQLTTVREEIETVRQYLFIQNVRFNNGITLECDIPEELLPARIPRLLLQPMAENAVLHGIRPRGGRGTIRVKALMEARAEGRLIIEISDNGVGFPVRLPEFVSCDDLKETLSHSAQSFSIGLKNTHERIRLRFGSSFGLFARSEPDCGAAIRLILPLIPDEKEEE